MRTEPLIVALIGAGIVVAVLGGYLRTSQLVPAQGCTLEAKVCPDGSTVGRTGPTCAFAPCPGATGGQGILPYHSGIRGAVVVGPVCPVERTPPDPACLPQPYATSVSVSRTGSPNVFATTESDATGTFELSLPPGTYTVSARGGKVLPRCASQDVTVGPSGYVTLTLSCDSGIR